MQDQPITHIKRRLNRYRRIRIEKQRHNAGCMTKAAIEINTRASWILLTVVLSIFNSIDQGFVMMLVLMMTYMTSRSALLVLAVARHRGPGGLEPNQ